VVLGADLADLVGGRVAVGAPVRERFFHFCGVEEDDGIPFANAGAVGRHPPIFWGPSASVGTVTGVASTAFKAPVAETSRDEKAAAHLLDRDGRDAMIRFGFRGPATRRTAATVT